MRLPHVLGAIAEHADEGVQAFAAQLPAKVATTLDALTVFPSEDVLPKSLANHTYGAKLLRNKNSLKMQVLLHSAPFNTEQPSHAVLI